MLRLWWILLLAGVHIMSRWLRLPCTEEHFLRGQVRKQEVLKAHDFTPMNLPFHHLSSSPVVCWWKKKKNPWHHKGLVATLRTHPLPLHFPATLTSWFPIFLTSFSLEFPRSPRLALFASLSLPTEHWVPSPTPPRLPTPRSLLFR